MDGSLKSFKVTTVLAALFCVAENDKDSSWLVWLFDFLSLAP